MLKEQLPDLKPLFRITLQAALYKVLELGRPVPFYFGHINVDNVVDELSLVLDVMEGWIASRQLICKTSERPDIDFLRVLYSRCDLW